MKKALLLHGTDGDSTVNWFPWLSAQLKNDGWDVWSPDLPNAHTPNITAYNDYLFGHQKFDFDKDTVIIGHSSGAVAALGLLQALQSAQIVKQCILIGAFRDDLGWDNLGGLFEKPFDYEKIKKQCESFLFIHSDNDPYCPLDHAEYLSQMVDGELKIIPDQKHFSYETDPKYNEFPELLKTINSL